MKHTKEPWLADANYVATEGDSAIAYCNTVDRYDLDGEENARRIVACVNACKGLTTEWLESQWLLECRQRDELLINLKKMVDLQCPITGNPSYEDLIKYWKYEEQEGRGIATDMIDAIYAIIKAEARK